MSSPSVDPVRGLVIVGSFDRYVYCLDSKTGDLKWKVSTDGGIMSSATILSEQGEKNSFSFFSFLVFCFYLRKYSFSF